MQPTIDMAGVLRRGFDLYKENILVLLLSTVLAVIISVLTIGILAGPMFAGMSIITLALIDRRDPKPDISDLFNGFSFFLPSLVFVVLYFVASIFGQVVLGFIPVLGVILSSLYSMVLSTFVMFTMFNIVDQKMEVVAAIQKSIDVVKTNFWIFLGLQIIASLLSGLGLILCGIGVFLTLPLYICALAIAYRDLTPAPGPLPPYR